MKLQLSTVSYDRPLRPPIVTAHGVYRRREGMIVVLAAEDGSLGIGDAAPLPGFSKESIDQVRGTLGRLRLAAKGNLEWDKLIQELRSLPSLEFAVSTALAGILARRKRLPIAQLISADASAKLAINGLIGDGSPERSAARAFDLKGRGFTTFKVKVGVKSARRDIARISAIIEAVPTARLRLDANAAWSFDDGRRVLAHIPARSIDFVEQPFPPGHLGQSQRLCRGHGLRLALDEEADSIISIKRLILARACDVLIFKPMILGSIYNCYALARVARRKGIDIVYTSSWESDIGIAATLHLAAALGPDSPAMGLSTAGMIHERIVKPALRIENGCLRVPRGPGLGLELADEVLERIVLREECSIQLSIGPGKRPTIRR